MLVVVVILLLLLLTVILLLELGVGDGDDRAFRAGDLSSKLAGRDKKKWNGKSAPGGARRGPRCEVQGGPTEMLVIWIAGVVVCEYVFPGSRTTDLCEGGESVPDAFFAESTSKSKQRSPYQRPRMRDIFEDRWGGGGR